VLNDLKVITHMAYVFRDEATSSQKPDTCFSEFPDESSIELECVIQLGVKREMVV
jgi:hypothetical protein